MCNLLLSQKVHTKELRISNISESLISRSSILIFSLYSFSLYDELHKFWDDDIDTGNNYFLSRSDDDLIVEIFVILKQQKNLFMPDSLLSARQTNIIQGKMNCKRTYIIYQALFSGNDTRMAGDFIGIHRDMPMRKSLLATVSFA